MTGSPLVAVLAASLALAGCEQSYPELVIINNTAESILVRNPSFNGCRWNQVLALGQATTPGRCLPGTDRVHFEKYDVREQLDELEARAGDAGSVDADPGELRPMWFPYQTRTVRRVGCGELYRFELRLDDMEQDFAVPGPYGH